MLKDATGDVVSDPGAVANTLATHFAHISSATGSSREFQQYKNQAEQRPIDFSTPDHLCYNDEISSLEFENALASAGETSPGEDSITYSMIRHAHSSLQTTILALYNRIFHEGEFLQSWGTSIVRPFLKPNKDPFQCTSYRSISVTSCLCNILEKL